MFNPICSRYFIGFVFQIRDLEPGIRRFVKVTSCFAFFASSIASAMPLHVVILTTSGHILSLQVPSASTVLELKSYMKKLLDAPTTTQNIIHEDTTLTNDQSLLDYARIPEWYVLDAWYKWMKLEVQVTLVRSQVMCEACGVLQQKMRTCSRCGTRYCCEECQLDDWETHKSVCRSP